jgi:modified peptide precursor CbpA
MVKGFGRAFCLPTPLMKRSEAVMSKTIDNKETVQSAAVRPDVIAIRKTCDAEGTGLSHYVLMDKQVQR